MLPAIKSEFRKLLTVRTTYLFILAVLAIVVFFAGYISGYRADAYSLQQSNLLSQQSTSAIVFVGFLLAFVGLLQAGHEYRYNTIMYTLTEVNRRYKVLLAKILVISAFAVVMSAIVLLFSPLCTVVGVHLAGKEIATQNFHVWNTVWTCLFCGWGYAMYALILLLILRNQIGAIITFLLLPLMGENILMLLLKDNSKYLPFTALQSVAAPSSLGNHTDSGHQALVVLVYVVIGLLVSLVLFTRRDAN